MAGNHPEAYALNQFLTVIVTTSPVRSNPSTDLIEDVFESFKFVPGLGNCQKIIVFDGYVIHDIKGEKKGRITNEMENNYKDYKLRLESLSSNSNAFKNCTFLALNERNGFGHAVKNALANVLTDYVMIVQHDFAFCREVEASRIISAMEREKKINYVGFISASSEKYAEKRTHGPNQSLALEVEQFGGEPFVKLMFWYDKVHIARTQFYREVVFGKNCCVRKGDFIEDRLGHWQLKRIYREGLEVAHRRFGTYLWYPDDGSERYVQHLEGRKFLLERVKAGLYPERLSQRHLWSSLTAERYERQTERESTEQLAV